MEDQVQALELDEPEVNIDLVVRGGHQDHDVDVQPTLETAEAEAEAEAEDDTQLISEQIGVKVEGVIETVGLEGEREQVQERAETPSSEKPDPDNFLNFEEEKRSPRKSIPEITDQIKERLRLKGILVEKEQSYGSRAKIVDPNRY